MGERSFADAAPAMRRALRVALLAGLAVAVAGSVGLWWARGSGNSAPAAGGPERLDVYGQVPAFSLVERSGRRVGRDDLRGRVWVVDFIYTRCTDSCPLQSRALARLQAEFAGAPDFRLVSISVDPGHDTPGVLRRYAARYGATDRWWFLTGGLREIYCLARRGFGLGVDDPAAREAVECGLALRLGPPPAWAHEGPARLVMHSPRFVLVDRQARIRAYHAAADPVSLERLRANVRRLLADGPARPAGG